MLESDAMSSSGGPASYRTLLESLRARVRTYVAKQLLLPRQEISELIAANLSAVKWMLVALMFFFLFLVALVFLVIAIIAIWLPLPLAALIAMGVFLLLGALLAFVGYKKLVLKGPERTIRSFKETIAWVRTGLLGRSGS